MLENRNLLNYLEDPRPCVSSVGERCSPFWRVAVSLLPEESMGQWWADNGGLTTSRGNPKLGKLSGDGGLLLTSLTVDSVSTGDIAREDGGHMSTGPGCTLWIVGWQIEKARSRMDQPLASILRYVLTLANIYYLYSFKRRKAVPEVQEETSCCITAVSFKYWSWSKVRRLLNTQQSTDPTQNLQTWKYFHEMYSLLHPIYVGPFSYSTGANNLLTDWCSVRLITESRGKVTTGSGCCWQLSLTLVSSNCRISESLKKMLK